jgi:tetratricopeptide (TPR) repeat protein
MLDLDKPSWRWPTLVATGAALALGWLWWQATRDPAVRFLPARGPAAWIVYPRPADSQGHSAIEMGTEFRQTLRLPRAPAAARLTVRAFTRAEVVVNDAVVDLGPAATNNWKRPRTADVTRHLRAGENRISVTVFNSTGPPALWLTLKADNVVLLTDESWEASCAGAVWRPARLASKPMPADAGNPLRGGERTWEATRERAGTLLLFMALAAGVTYLIRGRVGAQPADPPGQHRLSWLFADPARATFLGVIAGWLLLFLNNLAFLPGPMGFDVEGHLEYVQYLFERKALPLPHEGTVAFNPPLYYLLSAVVLGALSLAPGSLAGVAVLRLVSLAAAVGTLFLVRASLRLLFPQQIRAQVVGLLVAGCLPMHFYVAHYLTNEAFLALPITAALFLCLRALRAEAITGRDGAGIGACLGAALLTKVTALLVVPFVFAALALRLAARGVRQWTAWLHSLGTAALVCALTCGWFYAWQWGNAGAPWLGAADARSAFRWWQDPGYVTAPWFLRAGAALDRPLFSGFGSFADGIYSTLWGDGLCGGVMAVEFRPPWNYELMAAGYLLALGPTLALLAGIVVAAVRFCRRPSPEWLLLLGVAGAFALALVYMALRVPYHSQIKAFYGLFMLLPLGAFVGLGLDWLAARGRAFAGCAAVLLVLWAMTSYATYWMRPRSAPAQTLHGVTLMAAGRPAEAVPRFVAALRQDPNHLRARSWLVNALAHSGRVTEARQLGEQAIAQIPGDAEMRLALATALEAEGRLPDAIEHTRQAVALAPDHPAARRQLALRLARARRDGEAVAAVREALRVTPHDLELHLVLGSLLVRDGAMVMLPGMPAAPRPAGALPGESGAAEALRHFRLVLQGAADTPDALNNAAWILAAHPRDSLRNGAEAVRLAERACAVTKAQFARPLGTLAAAFATAGRFEEAVAQIEQAATLAHATGDTALAAQLGRMRAGFIARQPYRDTSLAPSPPAP